MGERIEVNTSKQVPAPVPAVDVKTSPSKAQKLKPTKIRYTPKKSIDTGTLDNGPTSSYNRILLGQGASISKQQKRTQELIQAMQALLPQDWGRTQEKNYTFTLPENFQTGELGFTDLAKVLKNTYGLSQSIDNIVQQLKTENPDLSSLVPGQVVRISKTLKRFKENIPQLSSGSSVPQMPEQMSFPAKDPKQNIKSVEETESKQIQFPRVASETFVLPDDPNEENSPIKIPIVLPTLTGDIPQPPNTTVTHPVVKPKQLPHLALPRVDTVLPPKKVRPRPSKSLEAKKAQGTTPKKAVNTAVKSPVADAPAPISAEILKARQYEMVRLQEKNQPLLLRFNKFAYQRADANGQKFDLAKLGGEERYQSYKTYLAATTQAYHEGFRRLEALAKNNNVSNAEFQKYYGQLQQMATGIGETLRNYEQNQPLVKNTPSLKSTIPDPSSVVKATVAAPPPDLTPKQIIQRQKGTYNNIKAQLEVAQSNQSGLLSPIASLWDGVKSHGFSEYNTDGSERSRWDPRKWGAQIIGYDASSAAVQQHLTASQTTIQKLETTEKKLNQAEEAASDPKLVTRYREKFNRQLEKVDKLHEKAGESVEKYRVSQEAAVDIAADIGAGVAAAGMYGVAAAGLVAAPITGGSSLVVTGLALTAATATGALAKPLLKASHDLTGGRSYTTQKLRYDAVTGGLAGLLAPVAAGASNVVIKKVTGTKLVSGLGVNAVEQTLGKTATTEGIKVFGTHMTFEATEKTLKTQVTRAGLWAGREAVQGSVFGTVDAPTRHVLNGGSLAEIPQVALQGGVMGGILGPIFSGTLHGVGKGVGKIAKTGQKLFLKPKATELPGVPIKKVSGLAHGELEALAKKLNVPAEQLQEAIELYLPNRDTMPLDGEAGRLFREYQAFKQEKQQLALKNPTRQLKKETQQLNTFLNRAGLTSEELELIAAKAGLTPAEALPLLKPPIEKTGRLTGYLQKLKGSSPSKPLTPETEKLFNAYLELQAQKRTTVRLKTPEGQAVFEELFPQGLTDQMKQNNKNHCFEIGSLDVMGSTPFGQEFGEALIKEMIQVQQVRNTRKYIVTFPDGRAPGVKQVEIYESEIGVPQAGKNPLTGPRGMQLLEKAIERSRKLALSPQEQTAMLADLGGSPGDVLSLLTGKPKESSLKYYGYPKPYETVLNSTDPKVQASVQNAVQDLTQRLKNVADNPKNYMYVATAGSKSVVPEGVPIFPGSPLLIYPEHAYAIRNVRVENPGTLSEQLFITLANPHDNALQVQEVPLSVFLKYFSGMSGVADLTELGQRLQPQKPRPTASINGQPAVSSKTVSPLTSPSQGTKAILQSTPEELAGRIERRQQRAIAQEKARLNRPLSPTEEAQVKLNQIEKEIAEVDDTNSRMLNEAYKMRQQGTPQAEVNGYLSQATKQLQQYQALLTDLAETLNAELTAPTAASSGKTVTQVNTVSSIKSTSPPAGLDLQIKQPAGSAVPNAEPPHIIVFDDFGNAHDTGSVTEPGVLSHGVIVIDKAYKSAPSRSLRVTAVTGQANDFKEIKQILRQHAFSQDPVAYLERELGLHEGKRTYQNLTDLAGFPVMKDNLLQAVETIRQKDQNALFTPDSWLHDLYKGDSSSLKELINHPLPPIDGMNVSYFAGFINRKEFERLGKKISGEFSFKELSQSLGKPVTPENIVDLRDEILALWKQDASKRQLVEYLEDLQEVNQLGLQQNPDFVMAFAGGNDGPDYIHPTALLQDTKNPNSPGNIFIVGATTWKGGQVPEVADFSVNHSLVNAWALGDWLYSPPKTAYSDGNRKVVKGTSYASPEFLVEEIQRRRQNRLSVSQNLPAEVPVKTPLPEVSTGAKSGEPSTQTNLTAVSEPTPKVPVLDALPKEGRVLNSVKSHEPPVKPPETVNTSVKPAPEKTAANAEPPHIIVFDDFSNTFYKPYDPANPVLDPLPMDHGVLSHGHQVMAAAHQNAGAEGLRVTAVTGKASDSLGTGQSEDLIGIGEILLQTGFSQDPNTVLETLLRMTGDNPSLSYTQLSDLVGFPVTKKNLLEAIEKIRAVDADLMNGNQKTLELLLDTMAEKKLVQEMDQNKIKLAGQDRVYRKALIRKNLEETYTSLRWELDDLRYLLDLDLKTNKLPPVDGVNISLSPMFNWQEPGEGRLTTGFSFKALSQYLGKPVTPENVVALRHEILQRWEQDPDKQWIIKYLRTIKIINALGLRQNPDFVMTVAAGNAGPDYINPVSFLIDPTDPAGNLFMVGATETNGRTPIPVVTDYSANHSLVNGWADGGIEHFPPETAYSKGKPEYNVGTSFASPTFLVQEIQRRKQNRLSVSKNLPAEVPVKTTPPKVLTRAVPTQTKSPVEESRVLNSIKSHEAAEASRDGGEHHIDASVNPSTVTTATKAERFFINSPGFDKNYEWAEMVQRSVESTRRKLETGELGMIAKETNQTLTESLLDDLAKPYRGFFEKVDFQVHHGKKRSLEPGRASETPVDGTKLYQVALEDALHFLGEDFRQLYLLYKTKTYQNMGFREKLDLFLPLYQGKAINLEVDGQLIELTRLSVLKGNLTWSHTSGPNIAPVLQSVEGILQKTLALGNQAKTPAIQQQLIDNIAQMHYRLAHAMPYERGSAGITDAFTKVLFDHVGIEVPPWKAGIAPDLKAFTMSEEDFVAQYGKTFFERPLATVR